MTYQKREHYTTDQLASFALDDLQSDYASTLREVTAGSKVVSLAEYAEECARKIRQAGAEPNPNFTWTVEGDQS